jgi:hypothetical protein
VNAVCSCLLSWLTVLLLLLLPALNLGR